MANRREFLQTAALLSALPLAQRGLSRALPPTPLDIVVFDRRYAEARDFGALAAAQGALVRDFSADITDLWKQDLRERWKASAGLVAGLSERPALFLLERLGWDHGQRVVFEAEHELRAGGHVRHRVLRSGNARLAAELTSAGAAWPGVLAEALRQPHNASTDIHPTEAAMAAHRGEGSKLYSWIIAPQRRLLG